MTPENELRQAWVKRTKRLIKLASELNSLHFDVFAESRRYWLFHQEFIDRLAEARLALKRAATEASNIHVGWQSSEVSL